MTRIYFTPQSCQTLFLGRNGAGQQIGLDICQRHAAHVPVVELVPVTGKNKPARAYQEIPLADVPALILSLQTIYEHARHLIGAPPLAHPPAPSVLVLDITYNSENESKRAAIFPDTPEGLRKARWTAQMEMEPAEDEDDPEPAEYCELFRCAMNADGNEYSDPVTLPLTEPEPTTPDDPAPVPPTGSPSEEQTDHTPPTSEPPTPEPAQTLTEQPECYLSPAGVVCITLQDDDPRTRALQLMARAIFRAYHYNDRPLTVKKYGPERCFWLRKAAPCIAQLRRQAGRGTPHAAEWADRIEGLFTKK